MEWFTQEEIQRGVQTLVKKRYQISLKQKLIRTGIIAAIGFALITVAAFWVWGWILLVQMMAIGCFLFLGASYLASLNQLIVSRYLFLLALILPSFLIGVAHSHSNLDTSFFYRLPLFFCFVLSLILFDPWNEKFHFWFTSLFLLIVQSLGFYLVNPYLDIEGHDLLKSATFVVNDVTVILGCAILLYIFLFHFFKSRDFLNVIEEEWIRNQQQQEALVQKEKELQQTVALLEEKESHLREQIQAYDQLLKDLNERERELKAVNEELRKVNVDLQKIQDQENRIRELEMLLREHLNEPLRELGHLFFHYLARHERLVVGTLYYWDSAASQLCLGAVYGYPEERLPSTISEKNRNLLYEAFQLKEPIVLSSHTELTVSLGVAEIHPKFLLLCPMFHHERVIGALELAFLNPLDEVQQKRVLELCNHFATFCFTKIWM